MNALSIFVKRQEDSKIISNYIKKANTFLTRFKGLLGTRKLLSGHGLLIIPCNSVHTIGMRYPIDVIYLSKDGIILKLVPSLKPFSCSICFKAYQVLELPADTISAKRLVIGDSLYFEE